MNRICSFPLVLVLAACAMFLLSGCADAQTSAGDIIFGQAAAYTGPWAPGGRYAAGILAAFKEVNDRDGGIKGRRVRLLSIDDNYNITMSYGITAQLLGTTPVVAMLGNTGSEHTGAVISLAMKYNAAVIAPMTGASVFRRNFFPHLVHLRAGYDDEMAAILKLFVNQKKIKRIASVFQNDPTIRASRALMVNAMRSLGMKLVWEHSYTVESIAGENFTQIAQALHDSKAQGMMVYTIEAWAAPFLNTYYKMFPNDKSIYFVAGSWVGDAIQLHFKRQKFPQKQLFVSQVTPHPQSVTSTAATKYRAALMAHEGTTQNADYISFEGYLAGRLAIEFVRRAATVTRDGIMNAIYDSRFYQIDELLVGPFSRDCAFPIPAKGRSSMCQCSQGLRYVGMTTLSDTYDYVPLEEGGEYTYDVKECYAPVEFSRPIILGLPAATTNTTKSAYALLHKGLAGVPLLSAGVDLLELRTAPNDVQTKSTAMQVIVPAADVAQNSYDTFLIANVGLVPYERYADFPLFLGLTAAGLNKDRIHSSATATSTSTFERERVFLFPTLQQELYSIASLIQATKATVTTEPLAQVTVLLSPDVPADVDYVAMVRGSLRAHYHDGTHILTVYGGASDLSAKLRQLSAPNDLAVVVGMRDAADMRAVLDAMLPSTSSGAAAYCRATVAVLFSEAAAVWTDGLLAHPCTTTAATLSHVCADALDRLRLTSNLPLWTRPDSSYFTRRYLSDVGGIVVSSGDAAATNLSTLASPVGVSSPVRHPLTAAGYFMGRLMGLVLAQVSEATGPLMLKKMYDLGLILVVDVSLGPLQDAVDGDDTAHACNVGPRKLYHYSVRSVLYDAPDPHKHRVVTFSSCDVVYPDEPTDPTPLPLGAIIGGSVAFIAVLAILSFVHNQLHVRHLNRHAPRTPPMCFLLTDIQSSTRLWETFPELMAGAVETHHRVIRRLIEDYDAYEVKTIGDAFMIATRSTVDGTLLAMDIQMELFEAEWPEGLDVDAVYAPAGCDTNPDVWRGLRVRIGVHHAVEVQAKFVSSNGRYDYTGQDVMILSKVESSGNGGQVLMMQSTFDALCCAPEYATLVEPTVSHKLAMRDGHVEGISGAVTFHALLPLELGERFFVGEERLDVERDLGASGASESARTMDQSMASYVSTSSPAAHVSLYGVFHAFVAACPARHQARLVDIYAKHLMAKRPKRRPGNDNKVSPATMRSVARALELKLKLPTSSMNAKGGSMSLADSQRISVMSMSLSGSSHRSPQHRSHANHPARAGAVENNASDAPLFMPEELILPNEDKNNNTNNISKPSPRSSMYQIR
eukprot:PhM_4_TR10077/c0_g1_i2/m.46876